MTLSVVLITKNASDKISVCLDSVKDLGGEIIVLDTGSIDNTVAIVKKYQARVFNSKGENFAAWRNEIAKYAQGEWLFYIDHDEEVTQELKQEILHSIKDKNISAYRIPRINYVFGKWLRYGGFWPDYVLRLMKKDTLVRWEGDLHEQPVIRGKIGTLLNALIHHKEDSWSEMVEKTNRYSHFEAKLLCDANHPQMTWWRFFRIMFTEFIDRLIRKGGILDGSVGILYGTYQMYSRFITYAKLWELQTSQNTKRSQIRK